MHKSEMHSIDRNDPINFCPTCEKEAKKEEIKPLGKFAYWLISKQNWGK